MAASSASSPETSEPSGLPPCDGRTLFTLINSLMFPEVLERRGLFRLTGKKAVVDAIVESLLRNEPDLGEATPFEIATALKHYLEATDPLIPFSMYDDIIQSQQIAKPSARGPALKQTLAGMRTQEMACDLLSLFVTMCREIIDATAKNQMDMNALCRIFGPLMVRPHPLDPRHDPNAKKCTAGFLKDLIRWFEYFFEDKEINLEGADKSWQRKRKRKTMQLLSNVKKDGNGPAAEQFYIINPKLPLAVSEPKKERSGFVTHTTYLVKFGAESARRNYQDFATLHFFLVQNFATLTFPSLPPKTRAKDLIEMCSLLTAFLAYVCTQDELFMDSLFTTRWQQFFSSAPAKQDAPMTEEAPSGSVSPRSQIIGASRGAAAAKPTSPISLLAGSKGSKSLGSSSSLSQPERTRSKQYKLDEILAEESSHSQPGLGIGGGDSELERKRREREQKLAEARRKREQRQAMIQR